MADKFSLSEAFLAPYKEKTAPFGFDGLGELVFRRTYARLKNDGTNEEWWETVKRVVEGTYTLQKQWIDQHALGWNPWKAQSSAQHMFERIFNLKFTPPGRGLWMAGTEYVMERGVQAGLFNCFAGEVQFLTPEGLKRFDAVCGTHQFVVDGNGRWVNAQIQHFGQASLYALTVRRGNEVKVIHATADHLWFVADKFAPLEKSTVQLNGGDLLSPGVNKGFPTRPDLVWAVVSVEETSRYEDVYCAVVPTTRSFVIEGDILTHNCSFISTEHIDKDLTMPFAYLMDMSMLGVGVGFDTKGAGKVDVLGVDTAKAPITFVIPDTREGWVESVGVLIEHIVKHKSPVEFDYSQIRGPNLPIKGFGGVSSGPGPLIDLHRDLTTVLNSNVGQPISITTVVDIMNLIGKCVVSGNVRRCLPEGTLVHTSEGLVPIEKIVPGMLARTSTGYSEISELVNNGRQAVWGVETELGLFRATAKHKMAVMTGPETYTWKKLDELTTEDSLVFVGSTGKSLIPQEVRSYVGSLYGPNPATVLCSNNADIMREMQATLAALGIPSNLSQSDDAYNLRILSVGIDRWNELIGADFSVSYNKPQDSAGSRLIPIKILSLTADVAVVNTFDISVPGPQEFVCQEGLLVHNTAEIVFGPADSEEYLDLKNYEKNPERDQYGWTSNNSILAEVGMDYGPIVERIKDNGEPGILWLDNAQAYSRMVDPEDFLDARARGANPSLRAGTKVWTTEGMLPIEQLEGKSFTVRNLGGQESPATCWMSSPSAPLYEIKLKGGHSYFATKEHKWPIYTPQGCVKVATDDLRPGHLLPVVKQTSISNQSLGDYSDGFLIGWMLGDGGIHLRKDNDGYQINLIVSKLENAPGVANTLLDKLNSLNNSPSTWHERNGNLELSCASSEIIDYFRKFGVTDKKAVPANILTEWSEQAIRGFIDGIFSSDGGVQKDYKVASVCLYAKHRDFVEGVSEVLGFYGIKNSIIPKKSSSVGKEFSSFVLSICDRDSIQHFRSIFSLSVAHKAEALSKISPMTTRKISNHYYEVMDVVKTTLEEPVWDINVDDPDHCFQLAHVITGNCNEQTLEHAECCCLVESFPHNHDSLEDYLETLKYAYLYGKTTTLAKTHWPETNRVMLRNRRIGMSMSGIVQFVAARGLDQLKEWCEAGYAELERLDEEYSNWLAIPKSIKLSSIKPSGCRPWDALTSTAEGILTLEELFKDHREGEIWNDASGQVVYGDGSQADITKTFVNGKSETLRIKMRYGLEVESTPDHKWWVSKRYDRSNTERWSEINAWKAASEIQPGDVLEIIPGIYKTAAHSKLLPLDSLAISMRGDANSMTQPEYMNPELAWLLGYLWGDGAMSPSKYRIRFTDEREENLTKAQNIIKEQFGLTATVQNKNENRALELCVSSKILWHWLIKNGIWKYYADGIDFIPEVVRRSSQEDILAFLAGLIDADGCVSARPNCNVVILSTGDAAFAKHVQHVALAVGIALSLSENTGGDSFQDRKSMWAMTSYSGSDPDCFKVLESHSVKMRSRLRSELPWSHEVPQSRLHMMGKVVEVVPGEVKDTYDIEVAGTHWYYAGAVKSHNTVSLLAGATPGVHFPESRFYIRRIRLSINSPLIKPLKKAGYHIEPAYGSEDSTLVVEIPIDVGEGVRSAKDVSLWEQLSLAAFLQKYWADNQVSVTVTFDPAKESDQIEHALNYFQYQLKGVSFLPRHDGGAYKQMPYESIDEATYKSLHKKLRPIDFSNAGGEDAAGEKYCDSSSCTI